MTAYIIRRLLYMVPIIIGVLLALPVAAVVTVLLRFFHKKYKDSQFYTP